MIAVLSVASIFNPVRTFSETENRELQQMPEFSLKSLFAGEFTRDYETFITDQFVARDEWIALKTQTELLLGKKDTGGVYFCDDGYLIEKTEVDDERIAANVEYVKKFTETLSDRFNIRTLIAPTASLIHADKLPAYASIWDQAGLLDRLSAELDGFVDCRDVLSAHADEYIFYRTDHHWTTRGAYYAYTKLAESLGIKAITEDKLNITTLSEEFYGTLLAKVNVQTSPDVLEKYESTSQPTVSLDINLGLASADSLYVEEKLTVRDKYAYFLGGNDGLVDITTSVKNGRTLLILKDSYVNCMLPLLVNHYERIVLIDLRSFNMGVVSYLDSQYANIPDGSDVLLFYNASSFADNRQLVMLNK